MSRPRAHPCLAALLAVIGLVAAACGDDQAEVAGDTRPLVVVTTNILGDVVAAVAGDQVAVVTVMPVGADPHEFQASAREVDRMRSAEVLVVNGGGFEEGLDDVIEAAAGDGVAVFEALTAVEPVETDEADGHGVDDHGAGEDADHDGAGDHDDHVHDGVDPHFFTDPVRMVAVVDALVDVLVAEVDGIDPDALALAADAYVAQLLALDLEVDEVLAAVPSDRRVLVTTHDVYGAFADRYGFEVVGSVIPGGSTADGVSAGSLAALADLLAERGVPAIFADSSSADGLAETLADEAGGVAVVELFSESLGAPGSGGATYLEMIRTNAERIAAALA